MTEPKHAPALSRTPDTLLILFVVAVIAWLATFVFVPGQFAVAGDPARVVAGSFTAASAPSPAPFFGDATRTGLLDFLFSGLVSGGRGSATVGLFAFILVIGGVFGIILRTGAVEAALAASLPDGKVGSERLVSVLFIAFSAGGAIFGMGEEAIAISLILVPALVRAGYDSLTAVVTCYIATQIGFATSWMNPFSVIVAQSIAGVPPMSGLGLRVAMWTIFTLVGTVWVCRYARRVRLNPHASPMYVRDAWWREARDGEATPTGFGRAHLAILGVLLAGIVWVAWGVGARGYYLGEIAAQFMGVGAAIGLIARFGLPGIDGNTLMAAFRDGAVQLAPAGLIVAAAKGIVLILGGENPALPSLLNSLLNAMSGITAMLPEWATALGMLAMQSGINVFIVSGSAQASVTMPLMAPLGDLSGVTRQTAVLAFQLGDGLMNVVVPTSAALMGCLAAARVDYITWVRFFWRPMVGLITLSAVFVFTAQAIGYA